MGSLMRVGLVGAGKFGGYHANKLSAHSDVDFAGVFDVSQPAASALAAQHNITAYSSFQTLLADVEALIIAAPAIYHGDYAVEALKADKHILIEKPLAVNLKQGRNIVELAAAHSLTAQVGHQERFVGRAIGLDKIPERPILIKARRLNPYSPRGTDTSVTMDLMTHDIDLVHWLMGRTAKSVKGQGWSHKSDHHDHVIAEMDFDGAAAYLEASRVVESGQRTLEISYPSGTVWIDLNAKSLKHDTPFDLNLNFGDHPEAKDSLGAGLDEFLKAIKDQRPPFISAKDGLNAIEVAISVDGVS